MRGEQGRVTPKDAVNAAEWNIRVLPPLRLSELGIDLSSDMLCLGDKRLILAVGENPVSHERVYLGLPQDPRRGEHLLLVLNTAAPVKDEDINEVSGHWVMPKAAREYLNSLDVMYNTTHRQDPFITPAYGEFVRDHVDVWLAHLHDQSDHRFEAVFRFLTDGKAVFVDDKKQFGEDAYRRLMIRFHERGVRDMETIVLEYKDAEPFYQFLRGKSDYEDLEKQKDVAQAFRNASWKDRPVLVSEFLEQMPHEDKISFGFHFASYERLLLDLGTQEVVERFYARRQEAVGTFIDAETVEIRAWDQLPVGERVGVRPGPRTGPGERACRLFNVPTPARFAKEGLYPLFAWRNANGHRAFLLQEEADQIRAQIPVMSKVQADVMLGRLELILLHPEIKEGLPEELALQGTKARPMRATSVGTLASVAFLPPSREGEPIRQGPATLMLTDENGILLKLEGHAARLAA